MNRTELVMRRRAVRAFINADPAEVVVRRRMPPVRTAGGGLLSTPDAELPPQTARIVQTKRRYDDGLKVLEAGSIPDSRYLLICPHNMDIEVTDSFFWLGTGYRVTGVHPFRRESILCALDFLGGPNISGKPGEDTEAPLDDEPVTP